MKSFAMPQMPDSNFSDEKPPRVWLMMGHRAGDNSQVLALSEALGWPFETKRFVYRSTELVTNVLLGPNLKGVVKEKSSALAPPWPDLILSAGRRNEPICRWIREKAKPQPVKLVHMGRPWAYLERFDLIVTTPQYRLPRRGNVLHNKTPLHRVTRERLTADAADWLPRLAHLPQPYIAVVLGGSSGPYSFDRRAGIRLAEQASQLAREHGGSLLVTSSARTPAASLDAFADRLDAPSYLFRWTPDAGENPYFAFLGLAERIVVTGDSVSMMAEACATRKPVYLFDLGEGPHAMRPGPANATDPSLLAALVTGRFERNHVKAFFYRQSMRFGPQRMTRDIRLIHKYLVEAGHAVWLGDDFPDDREIPALCCVQRAANAVRALFGLPPLASHPSLEAGEGGTSLRVSPQEIRPEAWNLLDFGR